MTVQTNGFSFHFLIGREYNTHKDRLCCPALQTEKNQSQRGGRKREKRAIHNLFKCSFQISMSVRIQSK